MNNEGIIKFTFFRHPNQVRLMIGLVFLNLIPFVLGAVQNEEEQFKSAIQSFNQQDWDDAKKALEQFINTYPNSRWQEVVKLRMADLETNPVRATELYAKVYYNATNPEWKKEALWGLAVTLFALEKYQSAREHYVALFQLDEAQKVKALYFKGLCEASLRLYPEAKTSFSQILNAVPAAPWTENALVGFADAELALKNPSAAIKIYDAYLQKYPEGDWVCKVLFSKAQALEMAGKKAEAIRLKHELITRYQESFEAQKAAEQLSIKTQPTFTIQVGAFSKIEYAIKLENRLRAKGYPVYLVASQNGLDTLHQVRVGSFVSREVAEKAGLAIEKKEKLPTMILTIPWESPKSK